MDQIINTEDQSKRDLFLNQTKNEESTTTTSVAIDFLASHANPPPLSARNIELRSSAFEEAKKNAKNLKDFSIQNHTGLTQQERFEIALMIAKNSQWYINREIRDFDLNADQEFQLALLEAKSGLSFDFYLKNYAHLNSDQRFKITCIFAYTKAYLVSERIVEYFGDFTEEERFEIGLIEVLKNPFPFENPYGLNLNEEEEGVLKRIANIEEKFLSTTVSTETIEEELLNRRKSNKKIDFDSRPLLSKPLGLESFLQSVKEEKKQLAKELFFSFSMLIGKGRAITEAEKEIFLELLEMRDFDALDFLIEIFFTMYRNPEYSAIFNRPKEDNVALLPRIILAKWAIEDKKEPVILILDFLKTHKKRVFKDKLGVVKDLLQTVVSLERCKELTSHEKICILEKIIHMPTKDLKEYLSIVQGLLPINNCREVITATSVEECRALLRKNLEHIFCLHKGEIENLAEKYFALEQRVPSSLLTYLAPLQHLHNQEINQTIQEFMKAILTETVKTLRYDTTKSAHLFELAKHPTVFEGWKKGSKTAIEQKSSEESVQIDYRSFLHQKICIDRHLEDSPQPLMDYLNGVTAEVDFSSIENAKQKQIARCCFHLCTSTENLEECLIDLQKEIPPAAEFYNDLSTLIAPKKSKQNIALDIIDTDDWQDLFLSGTEVEGSCQRINASTDTNKCLMGYVIDGKNRMVAIVDRKSSKIIARSIIRLLLQTDGSPAIFQERIYPFTCAKEHQDALNVLVKEKAATLGVKLLNEENRQGIRLHSLGSVAAFEYSDGAAATGNGNIHKNGIFIIDA